MKKVLVKHKTWQRHKKKIPCILISRNHVTVKPRESSSMADIEHLLAEGITDGNK